MRAGNGAQQQIPQERAEPRMAARGMGAAATGTRLSQSLPSRMPDAGLVPKPPMPFTLPPEKKRDLQSGSHLTGGAGTLGVSPRPEDDAMNRLVQSGRSRHDADKLVPGMSLLHLLVVDEDEPVLRAICEISADLGFRVHAASSANSAVEAMERHALDVVLMDLRSREGGLRLLEQLRNRFPRVPIVVMTAFGTVHSAAEAMRLGANNYLTKPFAMEELKGTLRDAANQRHFDLESRRLQEAIQGDTGEGAIVGGSPGIQKLLRIVSKVAAATHPVLILGESGTGKETVAKLIHRNGLGKANGTTVPSQSGDKSPEPCPFLHIDCAAMPPALQEAEIFGSVRGDGIAGHEEKRGVLTREGGCTLYLEEIAAMPLDLQARLQRALQERAVRSTGGANGLPTTMRLIASSTRDLSELVDSGKFRKDLYLRLSIVNLRIPPLRERREDIPLLATFFLDRQARKSGREFQLHKEVLQMLDGYHWGGNVSELQTAIERACSIASGPLICLIDLPTQMHCYREQLGIESVRIDERSTTETVLPNQELRDRGAQPKWTDIKPIADVERRTILNTMELLNGDKLMAAKLLGIGKTTLYRKLKEYGITED